MPRFLNWFRVCKAISQTHHPFPTVLIRIRGGATITRHPVTTHAYTHAIKFKSCNAISNATETAVIRVGDVLMEMDARTFTVGELEFGDEALPFYTEEFDITEATKGSGSSNYHEIRRNERSAIQVRKTKIGCLSVKGGIEDFENSYGLLGDFFSVMPRVVMVVSLKKPLSLGWNGKSVKTILNSLVRTASHSCPMNVAARRL